MTMSYKSEANIVVIGGGTGSFTVLSGLKKYTKKLSAIVNMADDGGSTGQLRDELGVLPPGDIRQCLVALSASPKLRDLFNYRFETGSLEGHAFGNIFLTALEKMTGSFAEAIDLADEVLNVQGRVIPVTLDNVHLTMKQPNKRLITGEHKIGNMAFAKQAEKPNLALTPAAKIYPEAAKAIEKAQLVVIAPGNLYGSLAPVLLVDGVEIALKKTKAKIAYVCNLVSKPGQTDGFSVKDFASEVERFMRGRSLDFVIYNTEKPSKKLIFAYSEQGEILVSNDLNKSGVSYRALGYNLLSKQSVRYSKVDKIAKNRSFIRHDPDSLAKILLELI